MKKYLGILTVLAILVLPVASAVDNNYGGASWASCNPAGNYGGWDKTNAEGSDSNCYVAWNPSTGSCPEDNRDAYFTVGTPGYTVDYIEIGHLDGIAETTDSFEVKDGSGNVLCSFTDNTSGVETWKQLECDVNIPGGSVLILHPTASAPWSACGTWGQVAVEYISVEESQPQIPEFSAIAAGIALIGSGAAFVALRKKR